jgi:hypothetical protein
MAGARRPGRGTGIAGDFTAEAARPSDAARELVACLPALGRGDRDLVAVICGALLDLDGEHGAETAMAVVEQMAMVVGARRLGDG